MRLVYIIFKLSNYKLMAGNKKKKNKNSSLKKEIFLQVFGQLSNNMEWLKVHVGEKKWSSRIKKASRLLSEGVKEKAKAGKTAKAKTITKVIPDAKPAPTNDN